MKLAQIIEEAEGTKIGRFIMNVVATKLNYHDYYITEDLCSLEIGMQGMERLSNRRRDWVDWLTSCKSKYDDLYKLLNEHIIGAYINVYGANPQRFFWFIEFDERVYTKQQLKQLFEMFFERCGDGDPHGAYKNFTQKHKIKLYSEIEIDKEIDSIIEKIKNAR